MQSRSPQRYSSRLEGGIFPLSTLRCRAIALTSSGVSVGATNGAALGVGGGGALVCGATLAWSDALGRTLAEGAGASFPELQAPHR